MTKLRTIFTIVALCVIISETYAQGNLAMIEKGFAGGDEYIVGKNMAAKVFYVLNPVRKMLPKAEAIEKLGQFFKENQPRSFSVVHDSQQDNVRYIIGKLVTAKEEYRIHLLMNVTATNEEINQIRIEVQ